MITDVDGISWSEDLYSLIRGQAKMADGENVIFKVLRNNEPMELVMTAADAVFDEQQKSFLQEVLAALADPEYEQVLSALQNGETISQESANGNLDVLRKMLAGFGCEITADSQAGSGTFEALNRVQKAFGISATDRVDAAAFSQMLPLLLLAKDTDGTYAGLLQRHYEAGEHEEGRYLYLKGCAYYAAGRCYRTKEAFAESAYGDYEARAAACVQEWSEDGEIWHNSDISGNDMLLEFTVNTYDESEGHYYEVYTEDGTRASALFRKGSGTVSVYLPGGLYRIRDAVGTAWYGMKDVFGREGHYENLRFDEIEGDEYLTELAGYVWTITINTKDTEGTHVGSVDSDWDSWNAE